MLVLIEVIPLGDPGTLEAAPAPTPPATAPARASPAVAAAAPTPPTERPARTPEGAGRQLSDRLQKQLNEGVRLRNEIDPLQSLRLLGGTTTTEADVRSWVRRTEQLLKATPDLAAEFDYRRGMTALESLVSTGTLEPNWKRPLDQRIANLKNIIEQLHDRGE